MAGKALTGIERQLVLEYLADGNVPLTISLSEESSLSPEKSEKSSVPAFPVAVRGEQMKVLDQGIIIIPEPNGQILSFDGKSVQVMFYFNKLALYFETKAQKFSAGLALVIPKIISKIEDKKESERKDFAVTVFYETTPSKKAARPAEINCEFDSRFPLFKVSDYNSLIEKFLSEPLPLSTAAESIADRIHSPSVIYLDSSVIVFASKKTDMPFVSGSEYALLMRFPIAGPVKERKVYASCIINRIYENFECDRLCACASFSSMREEDSRFLEDKIASSAT